VTEGFCPSGSTKRERERERERGKVKGGGISDRGIMC
jgi:hypothetical protein